MQVDHRLFVPAARASRFGRLAASMAVPLCLALAACGGGTDSTAAAAAAAQVKANAAPVAVAGRIQNVLTGTTVRVDASASSDPDSDPLTYRWAFASRPAGSAAAFSSTASALSSFVADVDGTYVVSLVVNDGRADSTASTVQITANLGNVVPMAYAQAPRDAVLGAKVTLDGGSSSDANGDVLFYRWGLTSKPAGSLALLATATSPVASFTPDVAGSYTASLIVSDGKVDSTVSTVTINVSLGNVAPVADAGITQSSYVGEAVRLDGARSSDANGDALTYRWQFQSFPGSVAPVLTDPSGARPQFTPTARGVHVLSLVVADASLSSVPSTVTVNVIDSVGPVAAGSGVFLQDYNTFTAFDETTRQARTSPSCVLQFWAMDRRSDGVMLGITSSELVEINPVTGGCIVRGATPTWLVSLAAAPDGGLYALSLIGDAVPGSPLLTAIRLYRLSSSGAAEYFVNLSGAALTLRGISFGPDGTLYGYTRDYATGGGKLLSIDRYTGATTLVRALPGVPSDASDIDIDAFGVLRTMVGNRLYRVSIYTGTVFDITTVPGFPISSAGAIVYAR